MDHVSRINLEYQKSQSPLGGNYTENKLLKIKMPRMSGLKYLDLGCNTGYYCNFAKENGASRVVGVDVDSIVISHAKTLYPGIEFYDKGWDTFPDGKFDVISIMSAIHYADDPIDLIKRIGNCLEDDGLLIIEGGIVGFDLPIRGDTLVPGWRSVGDKCRHLSFGYIQNFLLCNFKWEIIGSSEPREGDLIPRYVIHAKKNKSCIKLKSYHTLFLEDFIHGLSYSAKTIVESQPSSIYVRDLENYCVETNKSKVFEIFSNENMKNQLLHDILFALKPSKSIKVKIRSCDLFISKVITDFLNNMGVVSYYE